MNLIPIPNPITIPLGSILHLGVPIDPHLFLTWQWQRHVFDTTMCDIDTEPFHTLVCPESEGFDEIVPDFLVVPVEVGLGSVE
jgi:hypothetical protein